MYFDRGRSDRIGRGVLTLAFALALAGGTAQAADTLHFAVGPLQPTPGETKKAFDPFFKHLAQQLGVAYTLEATTDWAGIAVALTSGQVDVAWMGPWGYVIAHNQGAGDAIATAKYDGKPVYHAIVIARPDLQINKWPDDGKGLRISFADVGSTSGWLIPTFWFKSRGLPVSRGCDPRGQRDRGRQWTNRPRDRLRSKPHRNDRERRHLAASDQDHLDLR
jgi:phosphate/phosphite/phosphonate ABC transporter binding protein